MDFDINTTLITLKQGKTLLYPTDTVYGLGCDAANTEAVKKIYQLKQREESKALICLVSGFNMLKHYVEHVPEQAYQILEFSTTPTTIIYDNPIGVAENLIAKDNSLAIRIITSGFAHDLISAFRKPIVSTSANISGQPTPKTFQEIDKQILKDVDYVVNLPIASDNKPSTIIKLSNNGEVKIIRK